MTCSPIRSKLSTKGSFQRNEIQSKKQAYTGASHLSLWCLHACSIARSCLTLCNPVDCSPPGFSVHGILQARILEWVSTPSSNVSVKIHHPSNIGWSRQCFVVQQECAFGGAFLNPILYIFPLIWADFMLLILLYVFITNVPDTLKRKDPVKANRTPGCRVALH